MADTRENSGVGSKLSDDEVQALAVRARAGDRAAFDELYHYFYQTIWRVCCSTLNGNVVEAEDVVQEAFSNAYRHIGSYHGETGGEFVGWLCTIAENACIDWIRHNRRWHEKVRVAMESVGSPFDWAQERTRKDRPWRGIWPELARFEPEKRKVFILRSRGVKIEEIARIMKRPPGTIKTWLHDKTTGILPVLKVRCAGRGG